MWFLYTRIKPLMESLAETLAILPWKPYLSLRKRTRAHILTTITDHATLRRKDVRRVNCTRTPLTDTHTHKPLHTFRTRHTIILLLYFVICHRRKHTIMSVSPKDARPGHSACRRRPCGNCICISESCVWFDFGACNMTNGRLKYNVRA